MLNNFYNFFSQLSAVEKFDAAKTHMSRPALTAQDFLAIFFIASLAGVFLSVVLWDYIKQKRKK